MSESYIKCPNCLGSIFEFHWLATCRMIKEVEMYLEDETLCMKDISPESLNWVEDDHQTVELYNCLQCKTEFSEKELNKIGSETCEQ